MDSGNLTNRLSVILGLNDSEKKSSVIFLFSLFAAGLIIAIFYLPALNSTTIFFDDDEYLVRNGLVQNPGLISVKRFFSEVLHPSTVRGYYQPLTMVSLMTDWALGGRLDNLSAFRRTSILVHTANSILVMILFYLLFGRWVGIIAGLLFGLHPLNVDSVVWIAERKTLLAGFFSLWTLILYLLYVQKKTKKFFVLGLVCYFLAMLSKPTSIMLPVLFLLLDLWPLKRLSIKTILEKWPFYIIMIAGGVVTYTSQNRAGPVAMTASASEMVLLICYDIVFYCLSAVWPVNMSAYHPMPPAVSLSEQMFLGGVAGTCLIGIILIVSNFRTRWLVVGWLFFFLAILPTLRFFQFTDSIAANRYMYLPLIGLLLPAGAFLAWLLKGGASLRQQIIRRVLVLVIAVVLCSSQIVLAGNYLSQWRSSESLYRYLLTHSPDSAKLHNNLGDALIKNGKKQEAIEEYKKAVIYDPNYVIAYNNLANAMNDLGNFAEAIEYYNKALTAKYDASVAYNLIFYNLGIVLTEHGRNDEAAKCFAKSIELEPRFALARARYGIVLAAMHRFDEAIKEFEKVLELEPWNTDMYCNIGVLLEEQGDINGAIAQYRKALSINPGSQRAQKFLEEALKKAKN